MKARAHGLTVTVASGRSIEYPWATGLRVDKFWDLHVYHGRRQRVYHPAGEWISFRCTSAVPPERPQPHPPAAMGSLPAKYMQRDDRTHVYPRPALQLDHQFTRTARQEA